VPHASAPWVLVYSGATSVGQYAVQLAALAGYRVVTTASPRNTELLKSLGAAAVVDYSDADVPAKIKEATGDGVAYALDTIAEESTQVACVKAFGAQGGKLVLTLFPADAAKALRPEVKVECASPPAPRSGRELTRARAAVLIYTALGKEFNFLNMEKMNFPAAPEDRKEMAAWMPKITELVRFSSF
jgi:NADPH:quinone reductase-like Zn-dependent oxidoreductase